MVGLGGKIEVEAGERERERIINLSLIVSVVSKMSILPPPSTPTVIAIFTRCGQCIHRTMQDKNKKRSCSTPKKSPASLARQV